jgi:hypothetical protein
MGHADDTGQQDNNQTEFKETEKAKKEADEREESSQMPQVSALSLCGNT